jgi:hypothetical protein
MIRLKKENLLDYILCLLILILPVVFTLLMQQLIASDYIDNSGPSCGSGSYINLNGESVDLNCLRTNILPPEHHALWFTRHFIYNMVIWYPLVVLVVVVKALAKRARKTKK